VRDARTSEPVAGAAALVKGTNIGTEAGIDGYFSIRNLREGRYTLIVVAVAYKTVEVEFETNESVATVMDVYLESEDVLMDEIVVSARVSNNTENALTQIVKTLPQIASGISAAQIGRSPDRVASEAVRRMAGVTIIDDRFIVVRGLSQRYNNAWINGLAVPGTETDSRAFPLDLVPNSQIDNLIVYKSPSPEIPGDFSGGFVSISSKGVPDKNSLEVGYSTGFNLVTHFDVRPFRIGAGSPADFLGFDRVKRPLPKNFPANMSAIDDSGEITRLTKSGFNNDWRIKSITPIPDQRFFLTLARRINTGNLTVGNLTSINYSYIYKGIPKMKNARYDTWNYNEDRPVYLDNYFDSQFSNEARIGVLHNWSVVLNPFNRIDFKNLFNILGRNRLTERAGIKDASGMYYREQTEIRYSSRLIYSGQFSGMHDFGQDENLSWDAGYSFAGRDEPDRRIVNNYAGIGSEEDIPFVKTANDNISRYFQKLLDNTFSAAVNYSREFSKIPFVPTLKTGLYGEYRNRDYDVREFIYRYSKLGYEDRQAYLKLPFGEMLDDRYLAADMVYIDEITQKPDNYSASVMQVAGYAAVEIAFGKLSAYAGIRIENRHTKLVRDRSMNPAITLVSAKNIDETDLLPSVNLLYKFSDRHQLRAAYGKSVNRPELRELSPSVYFDFDLFGEIGGNENLKTAKIDNIELRYEFYPAKGETASLGIFYKYFKNPIEWTFIDMGGSLRYSYENADRAASRGIELDIRKTLDFAGLPRLSLTLNMALIAGDVHFKTGEVVSEPDRAMQGQSPYVINAGISYRSEKHGLDIAALYNRIGRRITGLGKSNVPEQNINNIVPDSYEMPRNLLDLTVVKRMGKRVELRCSLKDILSEDIVFKQFPKFIKENTVSEREQTTKRYNPGLSVSFGASIKF
jgi:outer membrane receptor protein involved in Fe transport